MGLWFFNHFFYWLIPTLIPLNWSKLLPPHISIFPCWALTPSPSSFGIKAQMVQGFIKIPHPTLGSPCLKCSRVRAKESPRDGPGSTHRHCSFPSPQLCREGSFPKDTLSLSHPLPPKAAHSSSSPHQGLISSPLSCALYPHPADQGTQYNGYEITIKNQLRTRKASPSPQGLSSDNQRPHSATV